MAQGVQSFVAYDRVAGFHALMSYGASSSLDALAKAQRIDTAAKPAFKDVANNKQKFLTAIGLGSANLSAPDPNDDNDPTGYYREATHYYTVVKENTGKVDSNSKAFWETPGTSAVDTVNQGAANAPPPVVEPVGVGDIVNVDVNAKYFNTEVGITGFIEAPMNRLKAMSENLTKTTLNKYVGQTWNGYYVYDYARVMADYSRVLDEIQILNCYLSAIMSYANTFNWIGSQLMNEQQPHSEVQARQRFFYDLCKVLYLKWLKRLNILLVNLPRRMMI